MTDATTLFEVSALNAACAAAIDADRLEEWPGFFHEQCLYKVTTADNVAKGYEAGIIYADSRAMLTDRIAALREANIYERQSYRHILGMPLLSPADDGAVTAETAFLVIRTMREGQIDVFATGLYRDRLSKDSAGAWRFRERLVICDSRRFDTLLAIPL
jgi:anthranilate 1,2-dioxygenase small subunit/terephthalate 1,2-dioxygenase oxygenase component beta subunit